MPAIRLYFNQHSAQIEHMISDEKNSGVKEYLT